tara:strand:- start:791 stop:943 length:153 start_codon:yes stop_codon:yes gene_type:complete
MDSVEAPVDKHGFTMRAPISDQEVILRCLRNAPAGIDLKQVKRLIKERGG